MKNVFYSILLFACFCGVLASCTGGDYNASPNSNANYVVNPLKPLTATQFSWGEGTTAAIWSGLGVMGATINGSSWSTNNASWYVDTTGTTVVTGYVGSTIIQLKMNTIYTGKVYPMNFHDYNPYCQLSDSVGGSYLAYYSFNGNSGELYITENDSAYIKGMFYCECISNNGQITAINNGYFNISKP